MSLLRVTTSLRAQLVLLVLAVLSPALALAWWAWWRGGPSGAAAPVLAAATVLLLAAGGAGALLLARRIARAVEALRRLAEDLRSGATPAPGVPTGLAECDAVARTLHDADSALRSRGDQLRHCADEAIGRARDSEQRVARRQRLEVLGRLTGGVAHDFNNLLGVVSNSAHLVRGQALAPASEQAVQAIHRAVDTGSRLTQHLLRFAASQPRRPQVVDLDTCLMELRELLHTVLGRRIALEVQVEPDTPAVRVDPGELELALINLGLNARDAIDGAGGVALSARRATAPECEGLGETAGVLLRFTDDGRGMPPELLARLTQPLPTTGEAGRGGSGGLRQVLALCREAGGTLHLASTPGQGTTVSMLLPAARSGGAVASEAAAAAHTPG